MEDQLILSSKGLSFSALERAALADILNQNSDEKADLELQLLTAILTRRENTGSGFFTYFDVDRSTKPLAGERMRSGGHASVEGISDGMGFILWLKDGHADCLEGYCYSGSIEGVDLTKLSPIGFKDYLS